MDYLTEKKANIKAIKKKVHVAKKSPQGVKDHRNQRKVARKGDKWYRENLGLSKEGLEKIHKRKS
jgi:hypothetical protein